VLLLCAVVLPAACGEPPSRELHQAEGAIETARAAGADLYAPDELRLAVDALERAREAVDERDYRLALSHAIDARERAQEAANEAAGQKAIARSDAESGINALLDALEHLRHRLNAARTARLPAAQLAPAMAAEKSAEQSLQEARAALAEGDYLVARAATEGRPERLMEAADDLDRTIEARPVRRRR
jgi:hypothetical protein